MSPKSVLAELNQQPLLPGEPHPDHFAADQLDGPVKLVRGEVVGVRLSREERLLVQFGQDTFGRHLLRFLLSGLGEKCAARRWLFIITFNSSAGADVGRRLYGEPDDLRREIEPPLPYGRKPLVILALMWLLIRHRRTPPARLIYEQLGQAECVGELSDAPAPPS